MPGSTFVVVADPALLPQVLGRPGLPKSHVYELGFFVSTLLQHRSSVIQFAVIQHNSPNTCANRKHVSAAAGHQDLPRHHVQHPAHQRPALEGHAQNPRARLQP